MNIAIILNYNDSSTTENCLKYMNEYSVVDKIIIVDNCSTDASYEVLKMYESNKIEVIKSSENKGYAHGNNFGIKYAQNRYDVKNFIISNPDIYIKEATIKLICNHLDTNLNVGAATAVIYDSNNNIVKNFAWKLPTYSQLLFGTSLILNKINEKIFNNGILYSKEILKNRQILKVDVLSGCFFIVKANILKEINYFDERTFLFCEENILAFKLREKSYESNILTSEYLIHDHSVSINKNIKSWKRKDNIYKESYLIYINNYLKSSKLKQFIYKTFFEIGKYDRYLYRTIKRL
ncbi:glycosyltransferase [Planococcus halotolerans]|uniref:glycosyltransferase n=1 Tax=Planococcus halotolerans TaxID=2233542 RepID=UPI0010925AA8|nr:glycosyltransferase family 2 protein [Planococcus halotolerans]QHJ70552.1 glycosyltransferase [Planococcus halotolerans]